MSYSLTSTVSQSLDAFLEDQANWGSDFGSYDDNEPEDYDYEDDEDKLTNNEE